MCPGVDHVMAAATDTITLKTSLWWRRSRSSDRLPRNIWRKFFKIILVVRNLKINVCSLWWPVFVVHGISQNNSFQRMFQPKSCSCKHALIAKKQCTWWLYVSCKAQQKYTYSKKSTGISNLFFLFIYFCLVCIEIYTKMWYHMNSSIRCLFYFLFPYYLT